MPDQVVVPHESRANGMTDGRVPRSPAPHDPTARIGRRPVNGAAGTPAPAGAAETNGTGGTGGTARKADGSTNDTAPIDTAPNDTAPDDTATSGTADTISTPTATPAPAPAPAPESDTDTAPAAEAPEPQRPETAPWREVLHPQLPFGVVLLITAAGIIRLIAYHWRQGAVLIGVALLVAAVFRAAIPDDRAGLLRVRSRFLDVLAYIALGGCMLFVAFTIQGGPLA
ncbi:MAG TPA: DUF3017 domain-containing protein [Pseudonocardiaceae bacterium]